MASLDTLHYTLALVKLSPSLSRRRYRDTRFLYLFNGKADVLREVTLFHAVEIKICGCLFESPNLWFNVLLGEILVLGNYVSHTIIIP